MMNAAINKTRDKYQLNEGPSRRNEVWGPQYCIHYLPRRGGGYQIIMQKNTGFLRRRSSRVREDMKISHLKYITDLSHFYIGARNSVMFIILFVFALYNNEQSVD